MIKVMAKVKHYMVNGKSLLQIKNLMVVVIVHKQKRKTIKNKLNSVKKTSNKKKTIKKSNKKRKISLRKISIS